AHGKRCQALGGAKNHCILMTDADMDMATNAIMGAAYGAAGERCMALSVVLAVGDNNAEARCSRLEKQSAALRGGPGLDPTPENEMGTLISSVPRNKVLGYIDSAESQGASLRVEVLSFSVKGH
ncbi:aldehyde dehydrogenase family protein, partial [Citrobacter portucalensis]